jgi:hypothetical protein
MYDFIVEIFGYGGWSWRQGGKSSKWIGYPGFGAPGGLGWGYNILQSLFDNMGYLGSGALEEPDHAQSEGSLSLRFNPDHPPPHYFPLQ